MGSRVRVACVVSAVVIELALVAWLVRGQAGSGHAGGDRMGTWLARALLLQHAGAHALLAWVFAATLRPGRQPLIGQVAERIHPLSPPVRAYTRLLTAAWVGYFATVATMSCAVYAFSGFGRWVWFAEVATPLLLASMFLGEHRLRYWLHPEFERVGLLASVRAYRRAGLATDAARAPTA